MFDGQGFWICFDGGPLVFQWFEPCLMVLMMSVESLF